MSQDLFTTLKKDHSEVKNLFKKITKTSSASERQDLLKKLREEILPHMQGEEKAVYPPLEKVGGEAKEHALESVEEHRAARLWMKELEDTSPGDEHFKARAKVLKEMVEHHIEEEEDEIFKALKDNKSSEDLQEVLRQFNETKEQAKKNM